MWSSDRSKGFACGIGAAALFGVSTPLLKRIVPVAPPLLLAGLLYLGAGTSLLLYRRAAAPSKESPLRRADIPVLVALTVLGGGIGPLLMLIGLARMSAVASSLLLNLEAPFTMVVAVLFFKEHLYRRSLFAVTLIVVAAAALVWQPGAARAEVTGVIALAGACLCWAVDNNLTQRLSVREPAQIVQWKALGAGVGALTLSFIVHGSFPTAPLVGWVLMIGAVCYGLSIVLDTYALRYVGAAREAALFATAPFVGALAAVPLAGERLTKQSLAAMALMALGVVLLFRERHSHLHAHEPIEHDHAHVHDEHHDHDHRPEVPPGEPHAHPHQHAPLVHDHPHMPDLHHRHRH